MSTDFGMIELLKFKFETLTTGRDRSQPYPLFGSLRFLIIRIDTTGNHATEIVVLKSLQT